MILKRKSVNPLISKPVISLFGFYFRVFKPNFLFNGNRYVYYAERKDLITHRNCRAVELPLGIDFIGFYLNKNVLEIGNVLGNYTNLLPFDYTVVDKYEKAIGVINVDIIDFFPIEKFDAIVSISTIEHFGIDEEDKEPQKVIKAIKHIQKNLLSPSGSFFATAPVGHNKVLDEWIESGDTPFRKIGFLKRVSEFGFWRESNLGEAKGAQTDFPYSHGNVIYVLEDFKNE